MAICHVRTSAGSASRGQSAGAKHDYVTREGKYARDGSEVEHAESRNMPAWAADDPRRYWQTADLHERANGRLYVEVQVALPNELDRGQRRALAVAYAERLCGGERLPYTVALHRGESRKAGQPDNPHAHIVISERRNDGVAREPAQWFRRANRQSPEKGGALKWGVAKKLGWCQHVRQEWAAECNRALEQAGRPERIDPRPLAEQAREALERGELERAAELSRQPEPKRGAGEGIEKRREAARERGVAEADLPQPSEAVKSCNEVRQANAEWRGECRQRAGSAERAAAEASAAVTEAERSGRQLERAEVERAVATLDEAAMEHWGGLNGTIARGAELQRGDGEGRGRPAQPGPARGEPSLGERFQWRWPQASEDEKRLFAKVSERPKHWYQQLRDRFQRQWSGLWTPTEPKPLPPCLAEQGRAAPEAPRKVWDYADALPERYRRLWDERRLTERCREIAERARGSLRARFTRDPQQYADDAVRRQCGPEAQRLDGAMRADRRQWGGAWTALERHGEIQQQVQREREQKRLSRPPAVGRERSLQERARQATRKRTPDKDIGWSR